MYVHNAAWFSVAVILTAVLGVGTVWLVRDKGWRSSVFVAGLTLMPMALYLTGTMRLIAVVVDQVAGYFAGFVFSPKVWLGLVLGVVGIALMVLGRRVSGRTRQVRERSASPAPARSQVRDSTTGDDMDDIEAILRKHGIQ